MLSNAELALLTPEERLFYENSGSGDKRTMAPALREKVQRRALERGIDLDAAETDMPRIQQTAGNSKEYKVFTSHDKGLLGRFDPESIEHALNTYAREGWVVVTSSTATFRGWVSGKDELIIILERDRKS